MKAFRKALAVVIAKMAPTTIPRSMPGAKGLDCYMAVLRRADDSELLVEKIGDAGVEVFVLADPIPRTPVVVPW
jgi:hypothetical protein